MNAEWKNEKCIPDLKCIDASSNYTEPYCYMESINIDYARKQAVQYGHSTERELCFLFTHGLLHLLGYDHMNEEEEKEMFALQDKILDPMVKRK